MTKYTAQFNGRTITRKTERSTFAFAWRVTGVWQGRARDVTGFSATRALAEKAARVYTVPASCWINPVAEIVATTRGEG